MAQKHTLKELNNCSCEELITIVLMMQGNLTLLVFILNVKYVNSSALRRIERMKQQLLSLHVPQSDETPMQVIADSDHPNSKCYMWVHRSGEFYTRRPIVGYEYLKGRNHQKTLFAQERKTGCFTISQKKHLPVQWYIAFLKSQSLVTDEWN